MAITNAMLAQQIADLVEARQNIDKQFQEWITGVVDGGVSSDGRYPLTDYFGISRYTLSPAQLEENVQGLVDSSSAHAAAALASENAAASSASAASTDEGLADAHRIASLAAQAAAEIAEASALNSSVNATASQVAAALSESNAATSETNAGISEANALASELAAAASAAAAATFDPANFYLRTALDAGQLDTRYYTESEIDTAQGIQDSAIALNTAKVSFPEAPIDGSDYVRNNGAWAAISVVPELNDLSAVVTWANIPIANVPTGTTGSTVALGNHLHTGVYQPVGSYMNSNLDNLVSTSVVAGNLDTRPDEFEFTRWTGTQPTTGSPGFTYGTVLQTFDGAQQIQLAFGGSSGIGKLAVRRKDSGSYSYPWTHFRSDDDITDTQITNWDAAFGWGDHAGLYSLSSHNHSGVYAPVSHSHTGAEISALDAADVTTGQFDPNRIRRMDIADTRAVDDAPNAFNSSMQFDFKTRTTTTPDIPGNDIYAGVMTVAPWSESSGGPNYQLAFSNNSNVPLLAIRTGDHGALGSDWGSWAQLHSTVDFSVAAVNNGNTAFGWGDHGLAGYAPLASPTFTGEVTLTDIQGAAAYVDINRVNSGAGGLRMYNSANVLQGYVYSDGSETFGLLHSGGGWAVQIPPAGTAVNIAPNLNALNGLDVTGNITVTGLVDGQDVGAIPSTYLGISATAADSSLLGGLGLAGVSVPPSGAQVLRSGSNGYQYAGWINTVSGSTDTVPSRIYTNSSGSDGFIRYQSLANFRKNVIDAHAVKRIETGATLSEKRYQDASGGLIVLKDLAGYPASGTSGSAQAGAVHIKIPALVSPVPNTMVAMKVGVYHYGAPQGYQELLLTFYTNASYSNRSVYSTVGGSGAITGVRWGNDGTNRVILLDTDGSLSYPKIVVEQVWLSHSNANLAYWKDAANWSVTMPNSEVGYTNQYTTPSTSFIYDTSLAKLASPTFTGTPLAPTPATADNTTKIATTAFVKAQGYVSSVGATYLNHVTAGYTSADVHVQAAAPGSPAQGDIWFDTDAALVANEIEPGAIATGEGGVPYYDDATYVGGKITVASTAPTSPTKGDLWIDTT